METYFWKLKHYNDYSETDETSYGAIGAESYTDAVSKLEHRFPKTVIDKVEIYRVFYCDGFIFFDSEEEWEKQLQSHKSFI